MKKFANIAIVMSGDFVAFFSALMLFGYWRMRWDDMAPTGIEWVFPSIVLSIAWILIFVFFGLYRNLYMISRFDEVLRVGKIVLVGVLFLFFLLFVDQIGWDANRLASHPIWSTNSKKNKNKTPTSTIFPTRRTSSNREIM